MLALSLTVIVLLIVNMAVDVHLRSLNTRRTQLEESQLARSILRMIADDLRGAVLSYEQDMSEIEALLQQSAQAAAQSLGQAAGGVTGGIAPNNSGESNSSNSQSQTGSAGGRAGSTGTSSSSMGSLSSNSGSSSALSDEATQNTADLSTTTIPSVPGLFGNQYQLQIDVSRLPRMENYQQYLTPDAATTVLDVPSDVKTVTYYMQSNALAAATNQPNQSLQDLLDPEANASGLVRRELDRSVTQWAMNNGNSTGLQNSGDVIAPEVAAIEFQYFDGTQWLIEWDTEVQQKLPLAVLVILAIRSTDTATALEVPLSELTPDTETGLHLYRMLVYLPAGGQSMTSESMSTSGGSSDSSATDSSSTGASL